MRVSLIAGMHRSGTSAVAGVAQLLGANLGDPDDHLEPAPDNPRGFFELRAVNAVNNAILREYGGAWDSVPMFVDGWEDAAALDGLQARAQRILGKLADDSAPVVLKDPRISLTLPFWRIATPVAGSIVCLRHPVEVAASLRARDGMATDAAADLWLRYTASALVNAPDALRIDYADLLEAPAATAARIAATLGLPPPDQHVQDRVEEFVTRDLHNHHRGAATIQRGSQVEAAVWLYEQLSGDQDVLPILPALSRRAASAVPSERTTELAELTATVERLRESEVTLRASEDGLRTEIEFFRARLQRTTFDLENLRGELDDAEELTGQLRASNRGMQQELQRRDRMIKNLRARRGEAQRSAEETQHDLDRLRRRRSVRVALRAAALARPVFRLKRGQTRLALSAPRKPKPPAALVPARPGSRDAPAPPRPRPREDAGVAKKPGASMSWLPDAVARSAGRTVTILIPVHDAPGPFRRCIESVVRNTTADARLLIVDDASRLEETHEILEEVARRDGVMVLQNETNLGFTRSVNRGLEACDTDVILLNSDTEVTPRWVERLQLAAHSGDRVGSSTAISDNAGAFAFPVQARHNPTPLHLTTDDVGRAVAQDATWVLPDTPTVHGFCTYLRRDMLDEVGHLDADAFPRGYGEENDLSMRALAKGWRHVVADAVFVRHANSASFGDERDDLIDAGLRVIDERYPDYRRRVQTFMRGEAMQSVRRRVGRLWEQATASAGRPRVLGLLLEGMGGTPHAALDLAAALESRWQTYLLTSDRKTLRLYEVREGRRHLLRSFELDVAVRFLDSDRSDIRRIVSTLIGELAIDLVHCHHVALNTFDAVTAARDMATPVVFSLHDYYLSCPTVHLLDERDQFCGGTCSPGDGACRIPMKWVSDDAPPLKHDGVRMWRDLVSPHLLAAEALVAPSRSARDVYLASYPELAQEDITVIEHGRDIPWRPVGARPPEPGERIRLLVPGNVDVHKGSDYLRRMLEADTGSRVEVHFAGQVPEAVGAWGTDHGTFKRDDFRDLVAEIRPHAIGILSIWAETHCYTLSESWMTGVPVLATDIGAPAERIREHGGGILAPVDDPRAALETLFGLVDDPDQYASHCGPDAGAVRTTADMAADYDSLYHGALRHRRAFGGHLPTRTRTPEIGLIAKGTMDKAPAAIHVRTQLPLTHSLVRAHARTRRTSIEQLVAGDAPDVVVVQRAGLDHTDVEALEAWLDAHARPLVFEIDDLLFNRDGLSGTAPHWEARADAMRRLMKRADIVTVSTKELARSAAEFASEIVVIPNGIDERLWFSPLDRDREVPRVGVDPAGTLRLLYVGTHTHGADLDLLRPVVRRLPDELQRPVRLSVVGVEADRTDSTWYRSIPVPHSHYPRFVPWIRRVAAKHDVALAPLVDTPFNRAKSNLKWLEYSAMGLPGVYADLAPYGSVQHGMTGFIAPPDDVDAWVSSITQLSDPETSVQIASSAQETVRHSYTLEHVANSWVDVLRRAMQFAEEKAR